MNAHLLFAFSLTTLLLGHESADFSPALFDEQARPKQELLQLLEIVGMEPLNDNESAYLQINRWSKKNLLRKGERWEQQTTRFKHLRPEILPILSQLGFITEAPPQYKEYRGALLH